MAIIDVIRFDGLKTRDWLIYKSPSDSFVQGSKLIVQEGQAAIFVKGGSVCDLFLPGTYTLSTENLPILKHFVDIPYGGKTPFSAEVYFIKTVSKLDIPWGVDRMQVIDPKYHINMHVRSYGKIGLRISDPVKFFKELIGGMAQNELIKAENVRNYFRGLISLRMKSMLANLIISQGISVLELSNQMENVSSQIEEKISPDLSAFGLNILHFYVESINYPDEDFAKINEILTNKAEFEIMGDNHYSQKRSFDIYEGAATNKGAAGSLVASGVGLGAAMNLGSLMNNVVREPAEKTNFPSFSCPFCGESLVSLSRFCPHCGKSLQERVCECGKKLNLTDKFCPQCGKKVGEN